MIRVAVYSADKDDSDFMIRHNTTNWDMEQTMEAVNRFKPSAARVSVKVSVAGREAWKTVQRKYLIGTVRNLISRCVFINHYMEDLAQ